MALIVYFISIFLRDLAPSGEISGEWSIVPQFSLNDGKSVARIPVDGNVDFYGTGEVAGDLRRNGKTIKLSVTSSADGATILIPV